MIAPAVYLSLAALGLSAQIRAQSVDPSAMSPLNLAYVDAQYVASGYSMPAMPNSLSTGYNMTGRGLLNVQYGNTVIENGKAYPASAVAAMPTIYITPELPMNQTYKFTLMMVDISAINNPDPQGIYRHYLASNLAPRVDQAATNPANLTFTPTTGAVLTSYAGPGPAAGTGKHRYAWLAFRQPWGSGPSNATAADYGAPGYWVPRDYCREYGCGWLYAATFFTVENNAPTFHSVPTSAINTATLIVTTPSAASSSTPAPTKGIAAAGAAAKPSTGAAMSPLVSLGSVMMASILAVLVVL